MPILAAYWGAECKYDTPRGRLNVIFNHYTVHLFSQENINAKLHLRPLWSITEDELRKLGGLLYGELYLIEYNDKVKSIAQVLEEEEGDIIDWHEMDIMQITNALFFTECANTDEIVRITNYLRANGFCVDQELVDAGLVEWK